MTLIALGLAVAPIAALTFYFYYRDKHEKEPVSMLVKAFAFGVVSVAPALLLEWLFEGLGVTAGKSLFMTAISAFIGVGLVEEYCKFFFIKRYLYKSEHFNEPYDGIIYSVMVSLGFAGIENIFYVIQGGTEVAILRMFTAVPAHAMFGTLMGYFIGLAKFQPGKEGRMYLGLLFATIFHGAYDFFLFVQNIPGMFIGAIISLLAGIYYARRAMRMHIDSSPFREDA